jgi:hypothetical protein
LKHFASPEFWFRYRQLPAEIQKLADKNLNFLSLTPVILPYASKRLGSSGRFASVWIIEHLRRIGLRVLFGFGSADMTYTIGLFDHCAAERI